jgi:hypothetical protein
MIKLLIQLFVTLITNITSVISIYYLADIISKPQPLYMSVLLILLLLGIVIIALSSIILFFMDLYKYLKQ